MDKITILKPDDWHTHFRDGDFLMETVPATARCFNRAIVMPNLKTPIINAELAMSYKQRILKARPEGSSFLPLMTIYLNSQTTPNDIRLAQDSGLLAAKLYPAGATTNSEAGVKSITNLYPIFAEMEALKMILLVHGEVTTKEVDIFDREKIFIEEYLIKITQKFPKLKVVFEHITTKDAVDFVKESSNHVAATMTPQHLLLNRNDLFSGGIKPHNYCLPILKRGVHQEALKKAASSGSNKFFLGTDSAPHEKTEKESACGCAGCYTAPVAIELYTQIFEELNALDKLEGFASHFGADFYGLPRNNETITLVKENWVVPDQFTISNKKCVVPFWAGKTIHWRLK